MKKASAAMLLVKFITFVYPVAFSKPKPPQATSPAAHKVPVPGPKKPVVKTQKQAKAHKTAFFQGSADGVPFRQNPGASATYSSMAASMKGIR